MYVLVKETIPPQPECLLDIYGFLLVENDF